MNLTPRLKLVLIIAVSFIVVMGATAALIYPVILRTASIVIEQAFAEQELLDARTTLAARKKFATQEDQMRDDLEAQKEQIPEESELSDVLRSIQNLAYKNDHWLFDIANTDPIETEGEAALAWEARFTVEGSWLNTLDFLQEMREMGRQVRFKEVVFERATDLRGAPDVAARVVKHWDPEAYPVRVSITCEIYYLPEEAVQTDIEQRKAAKEAAAAAEAGAPSPNSDENVAETEGGQQ